MIHAERCEACRFRRGGGECWRYPPTPLRYGQRRPLMEADDWCGEFQVRQPAAQPEKAKRRTA